MAVVERLVIRIGQQREQLLVTLIFYLFLLAIRSVEPNMLTYELVLLLDTVSRCCCWNCL